MTTPSSAMKHIRAFVNSRSLVPLLQKLRGIEGLPALTIADHQNSGDEIEILLHIIVPEEMVSSVVATLRAEGGDNIIVTPVTPSDS